MQFEKEDTIREATMNDVGWFFRKASKRDWNGIEPPFIDCGRLDYCDGFSVAEYGNEVIGAVATSSKGMDGSAMPTIANLYVLRDFSRRGVGVRLFVDAMERLLSPGTPKVFCLAITKGMVRTIDKLPQKLKERLEYRVDLSEDWAEVREIREKTKQEEVESMVPTSESSSSRWQTGVCRECGHRMKMQRQEIERASPRRCRVCGGMLDFVD